MGIRPVHRRCAGPEGMRLKGRGAKGGFQGRLQKQLPAVAKAVTGGCTSGWEAVCAGDEPVEGPLGARLGDTRHKCRGRLPGVVGWSKIMPLGGLKGEGRWGGVNGMCFFQKQFQTICVPPSNVRSDTSVLYCTVLCSAVLCGAVLCCAFLQKFCHFRTPQPCQPAPKPSGI